MNGVSGINSARVWFIIFNTVFSIYVIIKYYKIFMPKKNSTYLQFLLVAVSMIAILVSGFFSPFPLVNLIASVVLYMVYDFSFNESIFNRFRVENSELRENTINVNKHIHDVKNLTIALESYLEQGRISEARERIRDFAESISVVSDKTSGNKTIDALIAAKEAEIKEICSDYRISVVLGELEAIDEIDFCILLGNAIDNAIEESRRISDKDKRFIEIRILPYSGGISILIKNKMNGSSMENHRTKKQDELSHGFGIEKMKSLCEKYSGNLQIKEDGECFYLSVFLPNTQAD